VSHLLDSNAVIALSANHQLVVQRVRRIGVGSILLSTLVMHELFFGAYKGTRTNETLRNIDRLPFETLPFETHDAQRAAEVRAYLQRLGTPIGPIDTLIAGQALARDLTLVTRNTREFLRVPDLRVENWEA